MLMVMICNPILYFFSARNVSSLIKARFGRFTDQERAVIKQVKEKFALILAVFYVCWLPNVINAVLLFFNSRYKDNSSIEAGIIVMDVMMGILNPLQAFLNALVYRGWAGCCNIKRPFSRTLNEDERPGLMESTSQLLDSGRVKETSPLLLNNEN
ncbi:G-protein coupled receptor 143-like [Saccoglossus kowalevskii]|uniref:G-protein coupled receptor 143-like n=1 Tax=Saccoglossus kowalevskii TaxID=10224 RepID=A0ABM0GWI3_SACKO|nr:PREDICTED: G-protein coupled receptor 143-like [Saccoglossus kowalevskii]